MTIVYRKETNLNGHLVAKKVSGWNKVGLFLVHVLRPLLYICITSLGQYPHHVLPCFVLNYLGCQQPREWALTPESDRRSFNTA